MKGKPFFIIIGIGVLALLLSTGSSTVSSSSGAGAGPSLIACADGSTCTTPGQFCLARPEDPKTDVMICQIIDGKGTYRPAPEAQASSLRQARNSRKGGK